MSAINAAPFYDGGAALGTVDVPDDQLTGRSKATWRLGSDGFIYLNGYKQYPWITPQTGIGLLEIRVDLQALGSDLEVSAGLGEWLSAVTSPEWGYSGPGGERSGTLDVQIRKAADGSIVDTAEIFLEKTGTLETGVANNRGSWDTVYQ